MVTAYEIDIFGLYALEGELYAIKEIHPTRFWGIHLTGPEPHTVYSFRTSSIRMWLFQYHKKVYGNGLDVMYRNMIFIAEKELRYNKFKVYNSKQEYVRSIIW